MSYWCSLFTSLSKAPSTETIWTVLAILASAGIAVGAAFLSARLTMANARELQDREHRRDKRSMAKLLHADLHNKLFVLIALLSMPSKFREKPVVEAATSTTVLEAALPRLGDLSHKEAASLLKVFTSIALQFSDARLLPEHELKQVLPRVRELALLVGHTILMMQKTYDLDIPVRFEELARVYHVEPQNTDKFFCFIDIEKTVCMT